MIANILSRDGLAGMVRTEQAALTNVLEKISDDDWAGRTREDGWSLHDVVGHIADGLFGLNRLVNGQLPQGPLDMDAINAHRREQNVGLSRAEVEAKLRDGFAAILATIESAPALDAAGPFGPDRSVGDWLALAVHHTEGHRKEIEAALEAR